MDGYAVFLRGDYTEAEGTNLPDMMDIVNIICYVRKIFFLHDIIVLGQVSSLLSSLRIIILKAEFRCYFHVGLTGFHYIC